MNGPTAGTCAPTNSGITGDASGDLTSSGIFSASAFSIAPPTYSGTPPNGIGLVTVTLAAFSSTSPAAGNLACWSLTTPGYVASCSRYNTVEVGVAYSNPAPIGSGNYSQVVRMGSVNCTFSNTATKGHYVTQTASASTCYDTGSSSYPSTGQVVGIALSNGTGSALIFAMNDQSAPGSFYAGVGASNAFTGNNTFSGAENFQGSTSLSIPVTGTAGARTSPNSIRRSPQAALLRPPITSGATASSRGFSTTASG